MEARRARGFPRRLLDNLGWADRFSSPANTARQRRYAAAWGTDSVYTPGFVLNGREWRGWFQRESVPGPAAGQVGRLTLTLNAGRDQVEVAFAPTAAPGKSLQVALALLGSDLQSDVTRGENNGHKLRHDFTVLHYATAPLHLDAGRFTARLPLPAHPAFPATALAGWVTSGEAQPPIQVTGGWLPAR